MSLKHVLTEIWSADVIPLAERRRLAQAAVARVQGLVQTEKDGTAATIASYEQVLSAIATRMESPSASVQEAKVWLRACGKEGRDCAAQLGTLSKLRNAAAHPLSLRLLERVERLEVPELKEQSCDVPTVSTESGDEASQVGSSPPTSENEGKKELNTKCAYTQKLNNSYERAGAHARIDINVGGMALAAPP